MKQVEIYTEGLEFYFDFKGNPVDKLRIKNKYGKIIYFNTVENKNAVYKLSIEDLSSFLDERVESRAFIYYGEQENEIRAEEFIIKLLNKMQIRHKWRTYYLYMSLDGTLRFITNQVPSAYAYFGVSNIVGVDSDETTITLAFDVVSKYMPINLSTYKLKNRKNGKFKTFESDWLSSEKMVKSDYDEILSRSPIQREKFIENENIELYLNHFQVRITPSEFLESITSDLVYEDLDLSVFDHFFMIGSTQLDLTKYTFRLPYPTQAVDEKWVKFDDDSMVLFKWYETLNGMFSNRISFLWNEDYKIYQEALSECNFSDQPKGDKPIVLVCEYPYKAQDNGLQYFKYLMEEQDEFEPYYIVSKLSKDLDNLEPYMSNVLFYKSREHIKKFFEASYLMHTHTPNYSLPVFSDAAEKKRNNFKKVFIQHGIIGVRNLEYIYGKQSNPTFTNLFVVSSEREKRIVRDEMFYDDEDIVMTGLARFDRLLENSDKVSKNKKILIMPTWRQGQERLTDKAFKTKPFYRVFNSLLNNKGLKSLAEKHNLTINFYLHNNFQKYTHLFSSDFVNIMYAGEENIQDLLKNHDILITDYSSVGLDFAIQNRKVLYYQFDENLKEQRDDSQEIAEFLPGPIINNERALIKAIKKAVRSNKLEKKYRDKVKDNLYYYNDQNARKRLFEAMKSMK